MKIITTKFSFSSILSLFLAGILFISCSSDSTEMDKDPVAEDILSVQTQIEIDYINQGIDDMIETTAIELNNSTIAFKEINTKNMLSIRFLPECATISTNLKGLNLHVTIDFGDACTTLKDDVVSGKIIAEITYNESQKIAIIKQSFDDFYFNSKKIDGTIDRKLVLKNSSGNPEVEITRDIIINWPDATQVFVQENSKRECIAGNETYGWLDNVYLITGSRTITNENGKTRTATILSPLKKDMTCKFVESGIIKFENNYTISLDYGDGTCDDLAIATINGKEYPIQLKKNWLK